MIDQRAQLRDYIDSLTRRAIDEAGSPAPQRHKGRSASRAPRYVALTAATVALFVAVAVISVDGRDPDRSVVATGGGLFVPPASTEGDRTRLPLVFPDGSTVDLVYPKSGQLAQLGFQPEAAVSYSPYGEGPDRPDGTSPHPCCGRGLTIKRGTIREVMGHRTPTKVYTGARGQDVPFFDSAAVDTATPDLPQLAFQFGAWTVLAFDYPASDPRGTRMTDEQRAVFASSLDGHEDGHGFLVLEPRPPLCLQTHLDGPNGTLGKSGPNAVNTVMLYLQPQPHSQGQAITERTSQGYGVWHGPSYTSLLLPNMRFELLLPDRLRWLKDEIEIANLKQDSQWRC